MSVKIECSLEIHTNHVFVSSQPASLIPIGDRIMVYSALVGKLVLSLITPAGPVEVTLVVGDTLAILRGIRRGRGLNNSHAFNISECGHHWPI